MSETSLNACEWLETDGLGGFASGTSTGIRTRRYHALLLTATTPPTGRMVLVNGFDAWVETPNGTFPISSQYYTPGVVAGNGWQRIKNFTAYPWPHWIYRLDDGTELEQEVFVVKDQPVTCLRWRLRDRSTPATLHLRPFLSGRDYHSLHRKNAAFQFEAKRGLDRVSWCPYSGAPGVMALSNGHYHHEPLWYYNFLYEEERARGLDCEEDLAAPGVFSWKLEQGDAALVFTTTLHAEAKFPVNVGPIELLQQLRETEHERRSRFDTPLHGAADTYLVRRSEGRTIVAGYPWFTDWGRDTLIAIRGLCLATGRFDDARDILTSWASAISAGMLPNRFPDQGGQAEFNAVDASLWFVVAAYEFLQTAELTHSQSDETRSTLLAAIEAIVQGYKQGTRFGIRADRDGLLAAGEPGVQLTWMDAKVGAWVVTPRIGKPVEIQALWLNALWIAGQQRLQWKDSFELALASFRARFWNNARSCLYDVVDCHHRQGEVDATLRPNQILAVGGLPLNLLPLQQAGQVVRLVEDELLTPMGLRSLGPGEPGYVPQYRGGVSDRDGCYHQGTVWPWLLGPFVEAWVRVHGNHKAAKKEARRRFLEPLLHHLNEAGLGHISEIADGDAPHTPRGCPFQAWSVGEVLRLDLQVLQEVKQRTSPNKPKRRADASSRSPKLPPTSATATQIAPETIHSSLIGQ